MTAPFQPDESPEEITCPQGRSTYVARHTDAMRDRLRSYGLFHEIISWKLRMFVPTDAYGGAVLARVLQRYPSSAFRNGRL